MEKLNEKKVINYYLNKIEKEEIQFLKNKTIYKERIKKLIISLRDEELLHNKIEISKELWKQLFEAAMSSIDPDKRGFDDLFEYFDKYVEFEELIFASDSFYRDHTMHCLWVYFLGEYIKSEEEFNFITCKMEKEYQRIKLLKEEFEKFEGIIDFSNMLNIIDEFIKSVIHHDAERCIIALTHDLGYPIKKINKINKSISKVLPYYGINNYNEFIFDYTDIQGKLIEEFIQFIASECEMEFKVQSDDDYLSKKILKKILLNSENGLIKFNFEEISLLTEEEKIQVKNMFDLKIEWKKVLNNNLRYYEDFESYSHGIMSAFLLLKTVGSFSKINLKYSDLNNIKLLDFNLVNLMCKQNILRAITDHNCKNYQITSIKENSDFLILMDELEEFSRISRANQNRQFINEFCKSNIYTEDGYLIIDFIFNNKDIDNLDPEMAFKGRCKRFLTLFNIPELDEDLKIKLRCIGELDYDKNVYELTLSKKYANIKINDEEKDIPTYLKSNQFYSKEEYMLL
ncbi:hypothetical protein [Oceanirhabdus sp. W0125-5]|uniref:hypothetical protein n=1 Tax=Oceanirhabdus sp. W0125-5 TaxID=2999116 RepID=UPI0022F304A6|nr:hypothetical protein [Oceanirhabdus sp. W0125-5]WBW94857.1 hypothetical protein OW730_14250 [Oceanirhabdus sp. W0125-5]